MKTEVDAFWTQFKGSLLKKRNNDGFLKTWLDSIISTNIQKKDGNYLFTLQAPTEFHKKWLQENLLQDLNSSLKNFYKKTCQIEFEIIPYLPSKIKRPEFIQPLAATNKSNKIFNPEYDFNSFIVGRNNEFAHSACLEVVKNTRSFNPLFIYGPSGLGKTHLLNALGQKILREQPNTKIYYLSAERFLNECIQSIQKREMTLFRKKYRSNCDVLLVDDIQMIARGEAVQEEFFHTFNDLHNQGARIVLCCDKAPGHIVRLEERIKTRLEGGLLADISYPDIETRLAILKHKMNQKDLFLSEDTCLKIAQACKSSIREMEGVLNKMKMMSELHGGGLCATQIQRILKEVAPSALTAETIQNKVAEVFSLPVDALKSSTRKKNIVIARQTAMYFIKKHLKKSLSDVGCIFNKKDHTTVINSIKKVENLLVKDPEFKKLFDNINNYVHKFDIN